MATTEPKHHSGRIEVAYTSGFVRTRMTACHVPSPRNAGRSCDGMSSGLLGIVVEVVVVVVAVPGTGTVVDVVEVVVVVDVVVVETEVTSETSVVVVLSIGHDAVATVGRICSGVMMSGTVVEVDESLGDTVTVVEVCAIGSMIGVIARASESAGATDGGSL